MQRRELVQLVQDHIRIVALFDVDHQTHGFFQIAFVANTRNPLDLSGAHQPSDPLDNAIAELLERNFVDHDPRTILDRFDRRPRSNNNCTSPRTIALANSVASADDSAGWEVRPRDQLHQFIDTDVWVVDQRRDPAAYLAQVVRRNTGCHTNGNTGGTVDQQVRESRWEDDGFRANFVVRWYEVDRVQFDVIQHHRSRSAQAGFGVSHRSRRKPGNGAEVPLFVDEHLSHVPLLSHAN